MANLGQIFTKQSVADFMVEMFTLADNAKVLDPCIGGGAFVESLLKHTSYQIYGIEIDEALFNALPFMGNSRSCLRKGDFFDEMAEYDGIIMNPPYIRQEEISYLTPYGITKQKIQEVCAMMPISAKANMYMYFILHGMQLLRYGGELIAIFPNAWINTPVGNQFKEQIIRHSQIQEFISVCGNPFEGNPAVDVCIIKLKKGTTGKTHYRILYVDGNNLYTKNSKFSPTNAIGNESLTRLKNIATIRRGITTGANKLFISPQLCDTTHQINIITSPKSIIGYSTQNVRLENMLAIRKSDRLSDEEQSYIHQCETKILNDGKPLSLKNQIEKGKSWFRLNIPTPAPLLFAYIIRKNMKFVYNTHANHVRDNFYMITPDNINVYLLMSLLNNYHVYLQLEQQGKTYGNGLLKIQAYDIADLQIPNPKQFTGTEISLLTALGKQLTETGKECIIDNITTLLESHYKNNSKIEYLALRHNRLGI